MARFARSTDVDSLGVKKALNEEGSDDAYRSALFHKHHYFYSISKYQQVPRSRNAWGFFLVFRVALANKV